ncbi:hypothetical protein TNCV_1111221 [Trichonephila clavipes]|nr:hypothetical protein TNCV_1111221 [Trichonephila clavipes]
MIARQPAECARRWKQREKREDEYLKTISHSSKNKNHITLMGILNLEWQKEEKVLEKRKEENSSCPPPSPRVIGHLPRLDLQLKKGEAAVSLTKRTHTENNPFFLIANYDPAAVM